MLKIFLWFDCVVATSFDRCLKKTQYITLQLAYNIWGVNDLDFEHVAATERSGGLLIMWNKNIFKSEFVVEEDNFLAVIGTWEKVTGWLCERIWAM